MVADYKTFWSCENEKTEKWLVGRHKIKPRAPSLSCHCSATMTPRQPPAPHSAVSTVVLNATVTQMAASRHLKIYSVRNKMKKLIQCGFTNSNSTVMALGVKMYQDLIKQGFPDFVCHTLLYCFDNHYHIRSSLAKIKGCTRVLAGITLV